MSLYRFKINRRPNLIEGVKIKESAELLFFAYNPVDFVLDGFGIINKKYLKKIDIVEDDIKVKIINLKSNKLDKEIVDFYINDINGLFNYIREKKILIQLELESDDYCLIGKIDSNSENSFIINEMNTKGDFMRKEKINYSKVRNIYIKTDYLISYELFLENKTI